MSITDPLVLPVDVTIVPVTSLSSALQARLKARNGEYALTRPQGRSRAKLVNAEAAALLEEFRSAKPVAAAVIAFAKRSGADAGAVLTQAFPLLRDCFNASFLVPASSPEAAPILPTRDRGDRIGRFEVLRCVQLQDDTELYQAKSAAGGLVAIKLVRPGATAAMLPVLAREAATLRHLSGAIAPALVARGRHQGRPWLATAWCAGISPRLAFGELRERDDPAARRRLLSHVVAVATAYARLHALGILHGDVHPDNLLIGRHGEVTLLDFGLAEPLPPLRLAGVAARGGVAPFLPPEHAAALLRQTESPAPTGAGEQYALAALLYALVTDHSYLDFDLDHQDMLRQILDRPPLPFARRGVAPWPSLERVLTRALHKDAAARFPSVRAFATALSGLRAKATGRSRTVRKPAPSGLVEEFLGQVHYSAPAFREWPHSTLLPPPVASVMFGAAGLGYALYRLACLRESAEALALADVWLARAEGAESTPGAFSVPGGDLTPEILGPISPFHSMAGVCMVRTLLALAMGERHEAERAADRFAELSRTPWHELDLTLGRSGTLLACSTLLEALSAAAGKTAAIRELGESTLASLWEQVEWARLESPGIAHGWAGILYASLRWCRAAAVPPPPGLPERLDTLAARAEPLGRGLHWPQPEVPDGRRWAPEQISGWCNGPAGFVHLWTLAHQRFHRPEYLALAESSAWSAWEGPARVPDLCCGMAGRAYGLLNLYKHTGAPEWLERARRLSQRASAISRARARRPLGLFNGIGGIVLLEADLARPEHAGMPCFESEDWPQAPAARA